MAQSRGRGDSYVASRLLVLGQGRWLQGEVTAVITCGFGPEPLFTAPCAPCPSPVWSPGPCLLPLLAELCLVPRFCLSHPAGLEGDNPPPRVARTPPGIATLHVFAEWHRDKQHPGKSAKTRRLVKLHVDGMLAEAWPCRLLLPTGTCPSLSLEPVWTEPGRHALGARADPRAGALRDYCPP